MGVAQSIELRMRAEVHDFWFSKLAMDVVPWKIMSLMAILQPCNPVQSVNHSCAILGRYPLWGEDTQWVRVIICQGGIRGCWRGRWRLVCVYMWVVGGWVIISWRNCERTHSPSGQWSPYRGGTPPCYSCSAAMVFPWKCDDFSTFAQLQS